MPTTQFKTNRIVKTHPFKTAYEKKVKELETIKSEILKRTGWSSATFYRKLHEGTELSLTEAAVVSKILKVPQAEIKKFTQSLIK